MEEQEKTVIVQQRLSRGVIRRRTRASEMPDSHAEPAPVDSQKEKPELRIKKREATRPVGKEDLKLVTKQAETVLPPKEPVPVVAQGTKETTESKTKRFVLSDEARKRAEENVQRHIKPPVPEVSVAVPEKKEEFDTTARIIDEAELKASKKPKPKEEERPRILSFKDRIRGHIDLKKTKPEDVAKEQKLRVAGEPGLAGHVDAGNETAEEKAEKQKKLIRSRKGVKAIGGDLDIEGYGRTQTLAQLSRLVPAERIFRPSDMGRKKKKVVSRKNLKQTVLTEKKTSKRYVEIDQKITVGNFAQGLGVKAGEIIKRLMDLGVMATINQEIDKETATLIAAEYQYEVRDISFKEDKLLMAKQSVAENENGNPSRPPVVTIMGHVDHGKTSLLDKIRSTNVASGEAGGITQHIGAYTVVLPQGKITFLDTPGHEAFTTMRLRGAKATDIVVLVVAADDGVMPQTEESIRHAQAAGVPIIVAVNKIDKPEADPEKIKRQLSEKGLVSEEWGGDVIFNHVSAKQGIGIEALLESILVQAEVLELNASTEARARGVVLEARLDRARGPVCTFLVQEGTLMAGDHIVAGCFSGKVRNMTDWMGTPVAKGTPSVAVEIIGLEGVPDAGDAFYAVESERDAKDIVDNRIIEKRRKVQEAQTQVTLEDMFTKMKAGEISELSLILKTDVQGSLEAIRDAVLKIGNEEVRARIIHAGVGGVNESDVQLAMASRAIIIGFNVRPEIKALHLAKEHHVDIKMYKVIYDLVNEVKLAMQGLLAPDIKETYLGRAEVRQAFEISKVGTIAGCMVTDGMITRAGRLRLLRDNVVLFEGAIMSLKRFKNDAKDVKQGFECGIGIEGYGDIKPGDVLEAFELTKVQKTL